MRTISGWHVLGFFGLGFGIIISVNLTLAVIAARTFPGLEVKNSYVASQSFDRDRVAQERLGWDVSAHLDGNRLFLRFDTAQGPTAPVIETAVFGRATSVMADQSPEFTFDGAAFVATVEAGAGNWNLRVKARAAAGTLFQQRIVVEVVR